MAEYTYDYVDELEQIAKRIEVLEKFTRFPDNESKVPTGIVAFFPEPAGLSSEWIPCDGRSLNTGTYAALFAVIGYDYGGSGSSFNVPNLVGRTPLGKASATDNPATGGSWDHIHGTPSHDHGSDGGHSITDSAPNHTHLPVSHTHGAAGSHSESPEGHSHTQSSTSAVSWNHAHVLDFTVDDHTHGLTTAAGGAKVLVNSYPSDAPLGRFRFSHGDHVHGVSIPLTPELHSHFVTGGGSSHSHTNPGTSTANHTHGTEPSHTHSSTSHTHSTSGGSHSHVGTVGAHTHSDSTPAVGSANPPVITGTWWIKR